MLRTNTNQMSTINANQSVSAECLIDDMVVANFNGNYTVGMAPNLSVSKSIFNIDLYNENKDTVEADYKIFEAKINSSMEKLQVAIDGVIEEMAADSEEES